jgi:hypothetical protein
VAAVFPQQPAVRPEIFRPVAWLEKISTAMTTAGFKKENWLFALLLLAVFACAISGQSLWIDEACTALKAQQPTLAGWWQQMRHDQGSDLQMPLYMLWIWGCGKIFGTSELALRAVNLFWFAPGLLALTRALAGQRRLQRAVFLTTALSPFAWYYLDEARPYAMQLGASLFLFAALFRWRQNPAAAATERGRVRGYVVAVVLLAGGSLLGMIWAAAALAMLRVIFPPADFRSLIRNNLSAWLVGLISSALLGGYYLWTLHAGARASAVGTTDGKSLAFVFYELLGFAGLGPGRLEIRAGNWQAFQACGINLALLAGLLVILLGWAIKQLFESRERKKIYPLLLLLAGPVVFILVAGVILHFRVLGRHFTPFAPVLFFALAAGAAAAWRQSVIGKAVVIGFFALYLFSSLSLRFAARHEKDNYRAAAALATAALAHGQSVWWNADYNGAIYYRVSMAPRDGLSQHGQAILRVNETPEMILATAPADVIIASRSDVYDGFGTLAEFLQSAHYQQITNLAAFSVWERKK